MPHGHGGLGENPEEIHAFVNAHLKGASPLATITKTEQTGRKVTAAFTSENPIVTSELLYTKDAGSWTERHWESTLALISDTIATAELPEGVTAYYINIIDDRDLIVSTEHVDLLTS